MISIEVVFWPKSSFATVSEKGMFWPKSTFATVSEKGVFWPKSSSFATFCPGMVNRCRAFLRLSYTFSSFVRLLFMINFKLSREYKFSPQTRVVHIKMVATDQSQSGKATMFQMIGSCDIIKDFYEIFENQEGYVDQTVYGNLRGDFGTTMRLDDLLEKNIAHGTIGSVKFSFCVSDTKISALLFNTGSCKLCGGFPMTIKSSGDINKYNLFLDDCKRTFTKKCGLEFYDAKIICLNGQYRITERLDDLVALDGFVQKHRSQFQKVTRPNLDIRGRRGAYKLYIYSDRKTHIAVDHKGVCQVFACKSIDELFRCFEMLK